MINRNKQGQLQQKAVQFIKDNDASIIEFGTGTGKTLTALLAAEGKILIVFKQEPHYQNWLNEIEKWNIEKDITLSTYDSLHKLEGTSWDIVILDEGHAGTDLRIEKLKQINTKKWVCLTATLPYDKRLLLKQLAKFKSIKYSLDNAIEDGIMPAGKLYIVDKHLDNRIAHLYYERKLPKKKDVEYTELKVSFSNRNNYSFGYILLIQCTEYQYYQCLSEDVDKLKESYIRTRQEFRKFFWLQKATQRKNWLSELKTGIAKKILSKLEGKRTVIFGHSKDQLESLGATDYVYSKHGKKRNAQVIQDFNEGNTDKLFNLKVLNEGMNLTHIEAGLIIAIDGKPLSSIQRMGRVWRSDSPEVYFIRIPFTRDSDNFTELFQEVKQEFIFLDENLNNVSEPKDNRGL